MTTVGDLLGAEAASADPDALGRGAVALEDISTTANAIRRSLGAIDSADWTGQAADAFRQKQNGEIPGELSKVTDSFSIAAQGLRTYALGVQSILDDAQALAGQVDGVNDDINDARLQERNAESTWGAARATRDAASDPVARAQAQAQVDRTAIEYSNAIAQREATESKLAGLQNQANSLRDDLKTLASACVNALKDASNAGIRNSLWSWADRHIEQPLEHDLDVVCKWISDHVNEIEEIALAVVAVVAVLAIIAVALAAPVFLPVVFALAADAIEGLSYFDAAADTVKLAADDWLVARGEESSSVLLSDEANLAIDAVGLKWAKLGEFEGKEAYQAADEAMQSSLGTWLRTGTKQAKGWITRRLPALIEAEKTYLPRFVLVEGGEEVLHHGDEIVKHVSELVHPLVNDPPDPVVGPFPGVCQGPNARVRTLVAPHPRRRRHPPYVVSPAVEEVSDRDH